MTAHEAALLAQAAVLLEAVVVRRDYSAGAWRVEYRGNTLSRRAAYPGNTEVPMPDIDEPICADTKRGAESLLAGMRQATARRIAALLAACEGVTA